MPDRAWFDDFVAAGPDYTARDVDLADLHMLIHDFARAEKRAARVAQDAAATGRYLCSDPQLLAMMICALSGTLPRLAVEGAVDHAVIERGQIVTAAPYLIGKLVTKPSRVVLVDLDWPLLLWPYLAVARDMYGVNFRIDQPDKRTLMVSRSTVNELPPFGPAQAVPDLILRVLNA